MRTGVATPNPSLSNSSAISIIQDLMEGFGWQNKSSEIYQADVEQAQAEQKLASAMQFYMEEQNSHTRAQLIVALNETLQSTQAEYDHAVKQLQYHRKQAEIEAEQKATGKPGYLSQWTYWIFDGVKNFFGSTTEQQVEKYQNLKSKHQIKIEKLSDTLNAFQVNDEETEYDVEILNSENVSLAHFPPVFNLSMLNPQTGFKIVNSTDGNNVVTSIRVSDVGDSNGDGYDDIITGLFEVSSCFVIFGRPNIGDLNVLDLPNLNGTDGFQINSNNYNDFVGIAVGGKGDINGDGLADFAIGFLQGYGGGYAVFGSTEFRSKPLALSSINGTNGIKFLGERPYYSGCGWAVRIIDDINGDKYDEFVIGAPYYQKGYSTDGRIYIVFGQKNLASIANQGVIDLGKLNGTYGFILNGESNTTSGVSISGLGDVNGDGRSDFVIGAPSSYLIVPRISGRVYVILEVPPVNENGFFDLVNLNESYGFKIIDDLNVTCNTGNAVSNAGDVNGDGYADIIIGTNSDYECPWAYVVFGGPNISQENPLYLSHLNGKNGFKILGEQDTWFGDFIGSADFNGDGYSDLIISSPHGFEVGYIGSTYILFGSPNLGIRGLITLTYFDGVMGFRIQDMPDSETGYAVSNAGDINVDGVSDILIGAPNPQFPNNFPPVYVIFGDIPPQMVNNNLNLYRSEQILLNTTHLAAFDKNHDNNSLIFVSTNITHGYFEDINQQNIHLFNFTQLQIKNQQIRFVHDGSLDTPAYEITVRSSGIAWTGPSAATIHFNPMPIVLVNNQLVVNQSQTIKITTLNLLATCNISSNLTFTITNITHGFFSVEDIILHSPVISFSQQAIYAKKVSFTQDGSPYTPSYQVSVNDSWIQTAPDFANVTFNVVPFNLVNNLLNIKQNETILLTSKELLATRNGYADPSFKLVITNITHGFFVVNQQKSVSQITFSQQAILSGNVSFTQDNSISSPIYWVAVNDGWNQTDPQKANITFIAKPIFSVNQFLVALGQSLVLSLNNLCANDCYSDDSDELQFNVIGTVIGGQFENNSIPGTAITSFTQKSIKKNQVKFISNGVPEAPRYQLQVTDPVSLLSDFSDGSTLLVTKNYLPINQNQTFYLTTENLNITSSSGSATDIIFSPVTVQHGYFSLISDISVPISTFKQDQVNKNQMAFVPDGGSNEPSCILGVRDSQPGGASGSFPCQINFASYPRLDHAFLKINLPDCIPLTMNNLEASDDRVPPEQLYFMVSDVVNDHFAYSNNFSKPITNFTLAEISAGKVYFNATTNQLPAFMVTVWNGRLYCQEDCPRTATIIASDVGNDSGGINSLLIGLLSSFGTLVLLPLVKWYVEKAIKSCFSSREDTPDSQVTNEALAQLWIGCCGVITHRQHEAFVIAFGHVVDKLNDSKQTISLRKEWQHLSDRQKREIKSIIAEKSQEVLVGEQSRFCHFFKSFCSSEATPEMVERKAEQIAIKAAPRLSQLFSPIPTIPRSSSINSSPSTPLLTGDGSGINLTKN